MLSLPGDYGYSVKIGSRVRKGPTRQTKRIWLVSLRAARKAARKLHGSARIYTRGPLVSGHEKRRFMSAIRLPTLDTATGISEWGVCCSGCTSGLQEGLPQYSDISDEAHEACQRMYTRRGVLEHGKTCEFAQKRWATYKPLTIYSRLDSRHCDTEILDERGIKWEWDEVRFILVG